MLGIGKQTYAWDVGIENVYLQKSCSPAIILPDADLQIAANRIGWGKFYNCGQVIRERASWCCCWIIKAKQHVCVTLLDLYCC